MIKLTKILEALTPPPPDKIYADNGGSNDPYSDLTVQQRRELFNTGRLLVPIKDPSRPNSSSSAVINLPDLKDKKRVIKKYSEELKIYKSAENKDIKMVGDELVSQLNYVERLLKALDVLLDKQQKNIK